MDLLWSYVYARKLNLPEFLGGLAAPNLRFFADSGAHSARTLGLDLKIEDYAEWLKAHQHWFTIYANLDVIGAPDATWKNQRYLEDEHGLSPMPVFHTGEPFSVLEKYIENGYTYIALGKLLGNSQKALTPWLAKCFEIAGDRAVFHGFGLTVWDQLRRYPFYSVDSSSWTSSVRFGSLRLFDRGRWYAMNLRDRADVIRHKNLLASYGITPRMMTKSGYDRSVIAGACAVSQYRAAQWLRNIHGPVVLPAGKGYPDYDAVINPKIVRNEPGQAAFATSPTESGHNRHAKGLTLYLADAATGTTQKAAVGLAQELKGLTLYLADSSTGWTQKAAVGVAREMEKK
jgi:hypothetical protein